LSCSGEGGVVGEAEVVGVPVCCHDAWFLGFGSSFKSRGVSCDDVS
jgi:hypothetical protein